MHVIGYLSIFMGEQICRKVGMPCLCFENNSRDRMQQVLRLGNVVPDFTADSTHGPIEFHKWIDGHWAILFSHPADFTVRA